jgi:glyoxylase-like metal-dependent hydrolase (beta-lactamase superfamily II)
MALKITPFYHEDTGTYTYVAADESTASCAVIDPVMDYEPQSAKVGYLFIDQIIDFIRQNQLTNQWILETHAHADHLSAAQYLKQQVGGKVGIGDTIGKVQKVFSHLYNEANDFSTNGDQFDFLLSDDETIMVGSEPLHVLHTPGHTPACVSYVTQNAAFVGDTLFAPDVGTARTDFPGGDAETLYTSIQKLLSLPEETALYLCHDYPPPTRMPTYRTTVAEQKKLNIHVNADISKEQFIQMRRERDAQLQSPRLLLPSLQVNIRAGELPEAESNGVRYLKIPLNQIGANHD